MSEQVVQIYIEHPVRYNWSGLFVAPNDQWVHLRRRLTDFELMAVQRGTLYIADTDVRHTVREGEYILMPPTQLQYGWQNSDCVFYWMHFIPTPIDAYQVSTEDALGAASVSSQQPALQKPQVNVPQQSISKQPQQNQPKEYALQQHDVTQQPVLSESQTDMLQLSTLQQSQPFIVLPLHAHLAAPGRVFTLMQQLSDMERRYMDSQANGFFAMAVLCELQDQLLHAPHFHSEKDNRLFEQIHDYVAEHINGRIRVKEIAERFGYNEKYLTTLFREKTDMSLKQYIISAKMERAQFLLCNTNASLTEISDNLCYWNEQSFSAAFRKVTGMTPSEYRESYSAGLVNSQ